MERHVTRGRCIVYNLYGPMANVSYLENQKPTQRKEQVKVNSITSSRSAQLPLRRRGEELSNAHRVGRKDSEDWWQRVKKTSGRGLR